MNLENAKVIVTGGSSGIGQATAKMLKEKGAEVTIAARDESKLRSIAEELGVNYVQCDVTNEEDVKNLIESAKSKMGGFNVLINNAGYGYTAPLVEIDRGSFEDVFQTNVVGAMLCAKYAAQHFKKQQEGNIVNIASTSALNGSPGASPYNATKFALRGMTQAWRQELRSDNIRVMLVNPSEVMTSFAENRLTNSGTNAKSYTKAEQETKLRGKEIAHTITSLLAMDDRGFITEATVFATNPQV